MKNDKGPIAETYRELQALLILEQAGMSYITSKCSTFGTIKAILQATEIGIQNLNDLLERIVFDIQNNEIGKASIKLAWFKDLNYLLISVTNLVNTISLEPIEATSTDLKIESLNKTQKLFAKLDVTLSKHLKNNSLNLSEVLETKNLDDDLYKFFHDYRIATYEITIWNKNLSLFQIPPDTTYSDFIGLSAITKAVNEPKLIGDTFFTQFRCLHQIPELLTTELNDYIEASTIAMREDNLSQAHYYLRVANVLLEITLASLKPIVENLSHNDYHEIRENLGLTSGSHSVNLHFHLFRDLYAAITTEYIANYFVDAKSYSVKVKENYLLKLFEVEILKLRNSVNQWRNLHLHLPRINLGENQTKSLIGAKEAVESAKKMQEVANSRDPLSKLVSIYSTQKESNNVIIQYIESDNSFDNKLGSELGKITQERFIDVQNREGYFANQTVFKNPEKRKI